MDIFGTISIHWYRQTGRWWSSGVIITSDFNPFNYSVTAIDMVDEFWWSSGFKSIHRSWLPSWIERVPCDFGIDGWSPVSETRATSTEYFKELLLKIIIEPPYKIKSRIKNRELKIGS